MRLRHAALLALVPLLAASCGSKKSSTSGSTSGPKTYEIAVDMPSETALNVGSTAYFPNAVSAHPGDTIKFDNYFTGEPHTVTLGTLVNAGLAAAQGLAANAAEPPALAKLPLLLPQGPGDAPQVAANPCFIASGDLPANLAAPCPVRRATPFTGKEPFYNSGFLANGTDFSVKLASTVAPGKYSFFCLLHRAAMSGAITVVPASQTVPAPSEVTASGKAAQKTITDQLKAAVTAEGATQLPGGKESLPEPGAVAEGIGTQSVTNALADVFVPTTISIPVGNTVTWKVTGAHNLTFNPPDDARLGLVKAPDGTFHANAKAFAPAAGPGAPDNAPPGTPVVIDGGSFDGTGFHSSGIMLAFGPPGSYSYKLTFTKAGSYSFECTIHPKMAGTVKVG